jgi:hypothetical protein
MALNLDDNKRPYFKQLNLDETFDEISSAVNALEASIPTASYTVYTATLTQSGTASPVAVLMENTIGGTPTWARTTDGTYTLTITGAFTSGKTFIQYQTNDGMGIGNAERTSANVITIYSYNLGDPNDNVMYTPASFEVRVYN